MRKSDGGRIALPREIDENLKRAYQARLDEGVPDRFAALLDALKAREAGSGAADATSTGGANDRKRS